MKAPLLVFGYGNPSRGDDALGPMFVDVLQREMEGREIEFLTDFQLQIEHALDLAGRRLVLFADAHVSCPPPCRLMRLGEMADNSYTTHAMTPSSVLHVFSQCCRKPPPPAFLLSLRGKRFELGEDLSPDARSHLSAALALARRLLRNPDLSYWQRCCDEA
jgi:hydrogenase maturation protease